MTRSSGFSAVFSTIKSKVMQGPKTLNYGALGEYVAYSTQVAMAHLHRFVMLQNLGLDLKHAIDQPDKPLHADSLRAQLNDVIAFDCEIRAALARANQAAALCGQPELSLRDFAPENSDACNG